MKWFLVTGAPCADIGKGSLCAALARKWHQCGQKIAYQKLEPCLQRSLDGVPSGAVGEIVRLADGRCVDFDVARVLFYAPHTITRPIVSLRLARNSRRGLVQTDVITDIINQTDQIFAEARKNKNPRVVQCHTLDKQMKKQQPT